MGSVKQFSAAFAVALVASLGLSAVSLAAAHSTPRVSLSISATQQVDKRLHFTYSVKRAKTTDKVVFQRAGAALRWRTVETLKKRSGSTSAPAVAIGQYNVRVAVLRNKKAVASHQKMIRVFGTVNFSALCDAGNIEWGNDDRGCSSSTAQVGQFLFSSATTFDAPGTANNQQATVNLQISPSTSCTSMDLKFGESAADNEHAGGSQMITQSVLQSNTPPVVTTFAGNTLQNVTVALDGGPVQITDQSSTAGDNRLRVLENGTLNCYTSNGVVPGS